MTPERVREEPTSTPTEAGEVRVRAPARMLEPERLRSAPAELRPAPPWRVTGRLREKEPESSREAVGSFATIAPAGPREAGVVRRTSPTGIPPPEETRVSGP